MNSSEAQERERIRWAAEETLRRWPAAQAAVLFGSRARGEHRPDSDWDIAIITARSGPRPDGLPLFDLDRTDIPVLTAERIRQRANALGAVECEIVRDGTLLAGHWDRPLLEGNPVMTEEDYRKWMAGALGHAVEAVMQLQVAAASALGSASSKRWRCGRMKSSGPRSGSLRLAAALRQCGCATI